MQKKEALPEIAPTPFYFIRHGITDWNLKNQAMGQKDIPLNKEGVEQAKIAGKLLEKLNISVICHSPLSRAKETAEIINTHLNCTLVPIEELREFNIGLSSGKIIGSWFKEWKNGLLLPGAESFNAFIERSIHGINKALSFPETVLVVAHGGTHWAIEKAIQVNLPSDLPNCIPAFHTPPIEKSDPWNISLLKT